MKKYAAIVMLNLMAVLPAYAVAPSEIAKTIAADTAYGEGKLSRLMFVAYKASLWTDAATWSYAAPFALSIIYHMGFTKDELIDRTISEMVGQGDLSADDQATYRTKLDKAFVDVKDGDRFTASFAPAGTVKFFHNGKQTAQVKDATFAKRFFDIWLSDKTTEPSLRRGLLGSSARD